MKTSFIALGGVWLASLLFAEDDWKHNAIPKAGVVSDESTAVKIAIAVWEPIYGAAKIAGEKPIHATLADGVWTVRGSLHTERGGVAVAEDRKSRRTHSPGQSRQMNQCPSRCSFALLFL